MLAVVMQSFFENLKKRVDWPKKWFLRSCWRRRARKDLKSRTQAFREWLWWIKYQWLSAMEKLHLSKLNRTGMAPILLVGCEIIGVVFAWNYRFLQITAPPFLPSQRREERRFCFISFSKYVKKMSLKHFLRWYFQFVSYSLFYTVCFIQFDLYKFSVCFIQISVCFIQTFRFRRAFIRRGYGKDNLRSCFWDVIDIAIDKKNRARGYVVALVGIAN